MTLVIYGSTTGRATASISSGAAAPSSFFLDTPEAIAAYLEAAFEDGDPQLIAHTLGVIARSRGMIAVAKEAGVTREALYKALSMQGDPRLSTLLGVMKALGMQLTTKPSEAA